MNFARISKSLAVAGVTSAMAAGVLVGVTTTSANAETGSAVYNCTVAGTTLPVNITLDAALPVSAWLTHAPVPISVPITGALTVPAAVIGGLGSFGIDQVGFEKNDFGLMLGTSKIGLDGFAAPRTAPPATGDMIFPLTLSTQLFSMPDAGSYHIQMPTSFTTDLLTHSATGDSAFTAVPCTIDPTAVRDIVPFTVDKQTATMKATGPKTAVKQGRVAKVVAKLTGEAIPPTGKVVAKDGAKALGSAKLTKGVATFSFKTLKPGIHKISLSYAGDKNTMGIAKASVVTVKIVK